MLRLNRLPPEISRDIQQSKPDPILDAETEAAVFADRVALIKESEETFACVNGIQSWPEVRESIMEKVGRAGTLKTNQSQV